MFWYFWKAQHRAWVRHEAWSCIGWSIRWTRVSKTNPCLCEEEILLHPATLLAEASSKTNCTRMEMYEWCYKDLPLPLKFSLSEFDVNEMIQLLKTVCWHLAHWRIGLNINWLQSAPTRILASWLQTTTAELLTSWIINEQISGISCLKPTVNAANLTNHHQEIGPFGSPDHAESGCNKYEDSVIPWYLWYLQLPPLHLGRQDGISCFCHCTCRLRTGAGMAHWVAHCGTVEAFAWCVGLRLRLPAANDPNTGLRRQRDPRPSYQAAVKYSCLVWNLCLVLHQQWCQGDACTTGHRRLSAWNIKQPLACIHLQAVFHASKGLSTDNCSCEPSETAG